MTNLDTDQIAADDDAEGAAETRGPAGASATFVAEDSGTRLTVSVDASKNRLIIQSAEHTGSHSDAEKRALDKLCEIIVGRPLQEAADHGAVYVTAALPDDCLPIVGIRTPVNAGPQFVLAQRLIRKIHAAAREQLKIGHRENAWYMRPATTWLAMSEAEQANKIKPMIAEFLSESSLSPDDAWISKIERGVRLTIAFAPTVPYNIKPRLLMVLERKLREQTGDPLELFMDELKDANRIRRL